MEKDKNGMSINVMSVLAKVPYSTINRALISIKALPIPGSQKRNARYSIEDTRKTLIKYFKEKSPISPQKKVHAFYNFKGVTGKISWS